MDSAQEPVFAYHIGIRAVGDQTLANQEEPALAGLLATAPDARTVLLNLDCFTATAAPDTGEIGLIAARGSAVV